MLTDAHKETRKTVCGELLAQYENGGYDFPARIVTGDETWLHHFEPETKRQSVEWHHANSQKKRNSNLRLWQEKLWLRSY
jgi:hypothetical protein